MSPSSPERSATLDASHGALVVRVGALVGAGVGLEVLSMRVSDLSPAHYAAPALLTGTLDRLLSARPAALLLAGVVLGAVFLAVRSRTGGPRWTELEHGPRLRLLTVIVAGSLAWVYATYPYNFHLDRAHVVDRLLLAALVPLVWWRPIALLAFIVALLPLAGQFAHPIGGFSWAAPILPIRALLLVCGFALLRMLTGRIRTADLVFVLCCLVAAHYWASGLAKLQLGWLRGDGVAWLLPATYAGGWLAFLDPATISAITAALARLNPLLCIGTLLLECGALLALTHRAALRTLLGAWIALHAAIFALTGILFWEWMLLDGAILLLLLLPGRAPEWPIFTRAHLALSVLLIGGAAVWFRPIPLAWLDSPASYAFRITATGASGRVYSLHPRFFAPYDYMFTVGDFAYLDASPRLPITWGATFDARIPQRLAHVPAEAVPALEAELGRNAFDPRRAADFDTFVRRFVGTWNARGGDRGAWADLAPPPKLWTFPRGSRPTPADPITRVNVDEVLSFFDGTRYHEVRRRPVRHVDIPPQPPTDR